MMWTPMSLAGARLAIFIVRDVPASLLVGLAVYLTVKGVGL